MERTFVMVKPDGVAKALVGTVIARLEGKGLKLAQMKMMNIDRSLAEEHYGEHKERPFFGQLVDFITSGPVVAMEWTGPSAITAARQMMGATNPLEAGPGTIRGDFALEIGENIVHGSDGPESAERELGLFFG
ncbi:MAG: nucleoside-diphosphate kinase [Acidimicrobiia bacterium]|nr:nucleoside-diphosphate kinase [Acidimicrobiia bacterium]